MKQPLSDTPLIRSVMTAFPHAIDVEAPLDEARQMMVRRKIRHLPVKDQDELVGLITDRDIKLVLGPYGSAVGEEGPRVRNACVFDVFAVETTTPLRDVVAEMARRRIGSALVTKDGRLAGIFTATDACEYLAQRLGKPPNYDRAAPFDDPAA